MRGIECTALILAIGHNPFLIRIEAWPDLFPPQLEDQRGGDSFHCG